MTQIKVGWRSASVAPISTLWNSIYAVYNADSTGSSSLKTSLYAVYNGESNANDSYGSNNGTAVGGLTYTTGKIGNAFTLNGTNAYVSIPRTTNEFDFTGDFSISVWINPTAQAASNNIFCNYYATSITNRFGINLYLQGGRVRFATYKGNTTPLSASNIGQSSTSITNGTWYHVVITKTTSNTFKMYINGVLQTLSVIDGNLSLNPVYSSLNKVSIGAEQQISSFFNGKIDALNTWTKELSASEITELYNSGNGAQYITDNFYKPTTNDALNTYNGTAQGGLTYTTGKINQAFQFNGSNAFIKLPTNSLNFTGDFSISAWVYIPTSFLGGDSLCILSNAQAPSWFNNPYGWKFFINGNQLNFQIFNNTNTYYNFSYGFVFANGSTVGNTWYHVTLTRKASTGSKFYINGSLKSSDNNTVNPSYTGAFSMSPTIGNLYMGNNGSVQNSYFAPVGSKIDALNIWQKELTQSEITELYNSGNGKQYPF